MSVLTISETCHYEIPLSKLPASIRRKVKADPELNSYELRTRIQEWFCELSDINEFFSSVSERECEVNQ